MTPEEKEDARFWIHDELNQAYGLVQKTLDRKIMKEMLTPAEVKSLRNILEVLAPIVDRLDVG